MSESRDDERGFTIVDKRGREEREAGPEAPEAAPAAPASPGAASADAAGERPAPPADFAGLVISLGTSALYHLGDVPDPQSGERAEPNLALARQTIDTLEVLEQKTHGNLTEDEQALLTHLLTDLRMRFVEAARR